MEGREIAIKTVESTSNVFIKEIKKLKSKSVRNEKKLYIAEGASTVFEAINNRPSDIKYILFTNKFSDISKMYPSDDKLILVSDRVFEYISETKSPQGIMAIIEIRENEPDFKSMDFVIYLDGVSDPGNIGTIVRTADAVGADCVVLSPECADIYNSKTVRSSMGSLFHINVFVENEHLTYIDALSECGFNITVGCLEGSVRHFDVDFTQKIVIALGNEAHGVSEELLKRNVIKVKIPIPGKAESLNVAVAGAVFMYETVRQRLYNG